MPGPDWLSAVPGRVPRAGRRRHGCLGCLGSLVGLAVLAFAVVIGLNALLAPWNFYMGGHFHWLAGWQGWGRLETQTSGGAYDLWIRLEPVTPAYRKSPIQGLAYLCTPRGERIRLKLGGSMPRTHGTDLTGVPLHFYMDHYTPMNPFNADYRPYIDLYGAFGDRVLVMEDHATIARAFNPDGTVHRGPGPSQPRTENVQVMFHESTPWTTGPACPSRTR
jgi:hypothetical protein